MQTVRIPLKFAYEYGLLMSFGSPNLPPYAYADKNEYIISQVKIRPNMLVTIYKKDLPEVSELFEILYVNR
jgi:hypothetical protein